MEPIGGVFKHWFWVVIHRTAPYANPRGGKGVSSVLMVAFLMRCLLRYFMWSKIFLFHIRINVLNLPIYLLEKKQIRLIHNVQRHWHLWGLTISMASFSTLCCQLETRKICGFLGALREKIAICLLYLFNTKTQNCSKGYT